MNSECKTYFMKKIHKNFLIILTLTLTITNSFAQRKIMIQNPNEAQVIGREIEVFEDKTTSLPFAMVYKRSDIDARFTQSIQPNPNFGVTASVIWARFTLRSEERRVGKECLE